MATRFFIKTIDPKNPGKEKIVWGSPIDGMPSDETEIEKGLWDGLISLTEINEDWGDCGGPQFVRINGESKKLGLDIAAINEETKKHVAYSSERGKMLEDLVIQLAEAVSQLAILNGDGAYLRSSQLTAAVQVANQIRNLQ